MRRVASLSRVLVLVVILGACSGCLGTMFNQMDYWSDYRSEVEQDQQISPVGHVWWIYGGTVTDICYLSPYHGFVLSRTGDLEFLLDLPFSFAVDSLLLPMTIVQQIVGRPADWGEETEPETEEPRRQQEQLQPEETHRQE